MKRNEGTDGHVEEVAKNLAKNSERKTQVSSAGVPERGNGSLKKVDIQGN